MEKVLPVQLQEIIFSSTDRTTSRQITELEKAGKIKKIGPRIYTGKVNEEPANIIRRNIFTILGNQYKNAVLSHRSALEFKPTENGTLFLTHTYTKKIELPGITLRIVEGPGPIDGDNKFFGELYVSQQARALLENLQVSKKAGPDSKTLPIEKLEERLEKMKRVNGEDAINDLRDKARNISRELSMEKEFEKLNSMISSLLSTSTSKTLVSAAAQARAYGIPYDSDRLQLFEKLFIDLQQRIFKHRPDRNDSAQSFANFAFFESYFSNYIEGTKFEIDEAKEIIEYQQPIPARDEDSHDILGTYQLVSNREEMLIAPSSGEHLLEILQYRHKVLLSARPGKNPGTFKDKNNFAGQTAFVDHTLVRGTLMKAFEYYTVLQSPFAKALYMMFVISEVHPFLDGNGRLGRVMMNAALVNAGESKIIIPTVYREDYLLALRKLTRQSEPDTYINMMDRAHEFSANLYGENREEMQDYLTACNAFFEDNEGRVLKIAPRK